MLDTRTVIHAAFVLLLPIIVAWFGLSVWTAILLVFIAVLWRWGIVMFGWRSANTGPDLALETISASHFVEKVRWCMDRLGVDYTEQPWAGTIGAFYLGRTVPRLHFRTGLVRSRIGNSADILRYLWGAYSVELGERAAFLEPTSERLALEQRIDKCGVSLQVWVYYHLLDEPELCKHAWGVDDPATPWWQRKAVAILFPLQAALIRRAFRIDEAHYRKSCERIEALLAEVETKLADGRRSILGGDDINYTDLAFAAIVGLWLQPEGYGGAKGLRIDEPRKTPGMLDDAGRWAADYPRTTAFISGLYAKERLPSEGAGEE